MRLFKVLLEISFLLMIGLQASAGIECPWKKWDASQFSQFSYDPQKVVSLSAEQVQEDLSCLTLILWTHYSLRGMSPMAIIPKINSYIQHPEAMTNADLLNKIFSFHEGFVDTHLSYQVAAEVRKFRTKDPVMVSLSEELESEQIYIRDNFTYFKPAAPLEATLSKAQSEFIDYIKKNDRPLVIDLRGNGGGDNELAEKLSNALFTPGQYIPKSEVTQIESPLQAIAFCHTAKIVFPNDAKVKNFCDESLKKVRDLSFLDLIKTNITGRIQAYVGMRAANYQSPIILITDSGCASACETIVEKLSAHPKVKIIGAHTYGALHYSNAISLILPNSGIWIAIPTRREVLEKDAPEGVGYLPDIKTDHIELENILRYLDR